MSLFSSILEKLGLKKSEEEAPAAKPPVSPSTPTASYVPPKPAGPAAPPKPFGGAIPPKPSESMPKPFGPRPGQQTVRPDEGQTASYVPPAAPAPEPMPMVDVMSKLEKLAAENPQKLDWKVSIVDLLKLLDIDSSFAARKELAVELGCPPEKMGDSAQMNTWLHKTVLKKLSENGGNIPKELLD